MNVYRHTRAVRGQSRVHPRPGSLGNHSLLPAQVDPEQLVRWPGRGGGHVGQRPRGRDVEVGQDHAPQSRSELFENQGLVGPGSVDASLRGGNAFSGDDDGLDVHEAFGRKGREPYLSHARGRSDHDLSGVSIDGDDGPRREPGAREQGNHEQRRHPSHGRILQRVDSS